MRPNNPIVRGVAGLAGIAVLCVVGVAVTQIYNLMPDIGAPSEDQMAYMIIGIGILPTLIALCRWHHNRDVIFLLNIVMIVLAIFSFGLLSGVAALGWVVALIWSVSAVRKNEQVIEARPSPIIISN